MSLSWNLEAVGLKSSKYTEKIMIFLKYVKFWAILLKIDIF